MTTLMNLSHQDRIVITGGAGFLGSVVAARLRHAATRTWPSSAARTST